MAVWAGRPGPLTYPQAIPIADYRRKQLLGSSLPWLALLLAAFAIYAAAASPWSRPQWTSEIGTAVAPAEVRREAALASPSSEIVAAIDSVEPIVSPAPVEATAAIRFLAQGQATVGGLAGTALTNALISIAFVDGTVIQPGAQFSFDEVARTWDYREDPRYYWSFGTSRYGLIPMRGGGVCWVSTALWRAALWAGLPTDFRENHSGVVDTLGIGTDATNTLVIRNDSTVPITVRAWLDDSDVNVALISSESIGRTARVRGPERLGPGRYVLNQDITWADGTKTTSSFYSGYYW